MGDTFPALSPRTVLALAKIVEAAHGQRRVARLVNGHVVEGTARYLVVGPDDFAFPGEGVDVRATALRVTATSGMEMAWPVSDLVGDVEAGLFIVREP